MSTLVLDSGALIALERGSHRMLAILDRVTKGADRVVLPRTVIAQVWRGTPRQANIARLVNLAPRDDGSVVIDELTGQRAREIGITIGETSHTDIVDVHVAVAASERGHGVLTSDDDDIAKVDPGLVIVHI